MTISEAELDILREILIQLAKIAERLDTIERLIKQLGVR
jgi:hypothetical protein